MNNHPSPSQGRSKRSPIAITVAIVAANLLSQYTAIGQTPTNITSSGLNTVVTTNGAVHEITGGTRPGNGLNLFHSFGEFTVGHLDTAQFLNTTPGLTTTNILGRVTGGNPSNIFGTIDTLTYPGANLFLMNPAGIVFGPHATLNVAGSVSFTTANYLRLAETDGSNAGIFHTILPETSVLTSAPVAAYGFLGPNPASITVHGSQIFVPEGKTLALIGGNIQIQSGPLADGSVQTGYLAAPGGQIHLASVASAGEILPDTLNTTANINGHAFSQFGTISISESSALDVSGESSGTVRIRGGQLVMDHGFIFAGSFGDLEGTDTAVSVDLLGDIAIRNQSVIDATSFGAGRTGDIQIRAGNLSLTDGSIISAQGFGGAAAGNISITSDNMVIISGTDSFGNGSLITTSGPGTGTGGTVRITATDMVINDQGTIRTEGGAEQAGEVALAVQNLALSTGGSVQTLGGDFGPSGSIKIVATESLALNGNGDFSGRIISQNVGTGGTGRISIETGALTLSNSAQILSETAVNHVGAASPKISIMADSLTVSGESRIDLTTLQGDVGALEISARSILLADRGLIRSTTSSTGHSGPITISADNMALSGGSQINSSTEGTNVTGHGGDISLTIREKLTLSGNFTATTGKITPTAIQSSTQFRSLGDAGQISISAGMLAVADGALIASRNASGATGNAGSITINATGNFQSSGGIVSTTASQAQGGDINITAGQDIRLTNGASVSASSTGPGNAGSITALAGDDFIMQNSSITTQATQASGGNIKIGAQDQIVLQNSLVSASVMVGGGGGGNISIDPNAVILQNSQVLAQAVLGNGGNIMITTPLFLADQSSLVSASSQFGLSGTVNIQRPTSNLAGTVSSLPSSLRQMQSLQTGRCAALADSRSSSLIVAGRDILPAEPGGWSLSPFALMGEETDSLAMATPPVAAMTASADASVSLRRLTPAGFLTQSFAGSELTGCRA